MKGRAGLPNIGIPGIQYVIDRVQIPPWPPNMTPEEIAEKLIEHNVQLVGRLNAIACDLDKFSTIMEDGEVDFVKAPLFDAAGLPSLKEIWKTHFRIHADFLRQDDKTYDELRAILNDPENALDARDFYG